MTDHEEKYILDCMVTLCKSGWVVNNGPTADFKVTVSEDGDVKNVERVYLDDMIEYTFVYSGPLSDVDLIELEWHSTIEKIGFTCGYNEDGAFKVMSDDTTVVFYKIIL